MDKAAIKALADSAVCAVMVHPAGKDAAHSASRCASVDEAQRLAQAPTGKAQFSR
ncbi:hypothetical protein DAQ1742_04069 [Dickeya aquatica]|uniref:Uncharacterized protein n=1 Tax=Dickeya aquatica TaxID=1401087 RepID=A0A375AFR7_9GAMM|nr:hypothetical protein DAQ1742_04069 [Dickeya aquatica]